MGRRRGNRSLRTREDRLKALDAHRGEAEKRDFEARELRQVLRHPVDCGAASSLQRAGSSGSLTGRRWAIEQAWKASSTFGGRRSGTATDWWTTRARARVEAQREALRAFASSLSEAP